MAASAVSNSYADKPNQNSQLSPWVLTRLGSNAVYCLNYGETKIGQDKNNDIITIPPYTCQLHCTIKIDPNGNISLTNQVNNNLILYFNFKL